MFVLSNKTLSPFPIFLTKSKEMRGDSKTLKYFLSGGISQMKSCKRNVDANGKKKMNFYNEMIASEVNARNVFLKMLSLE